MVYSRPMWGSFPLFIDGQAVMSFHAARRNVWRFGMAKQSWNWKDEGFSSEPKQVRLSHRVVVYRAWGGTSQEFGNPLGAGVCFSFDKPQTRLQAEGLFAVWEYGNACRFLTEFQIFPGTTVYIGKVDPGDFYDHGLGVPGSQVFVETGDKAFVHKIGQHTLIDDLGRIPILPTRDPGKRNSS